MSVIDEIAVEREIKVTAAAIKVGLRTSFGTDGHRVFFEVGDDTGTRVRRHADAVAIGIWPSTGHQIHGFEIKVSRGDFLAEMKSPEKSQPVFRYCHRWSLVTPPGLVKVSELPPNWGLMTFDGKTMRTVQQAPRLTPEPPTSGFMAALVRRAGDMDSEIILAAVKKARGDWEADMERRRKEQPLTKWEVDSLKSRVDEAERVVAKIKEVLPDLNVYNIDQYTAAIKAAQKAGLSGQYNNIVGLLNTMEGACASIRNHYNAAGFDLPTKEPRP